MVTTPNIGRGCDENHIIVVSGSNLTAASPWRDREKALRERENLPANSFDAGSRHHIGLRSLEILGSRGGPRSRSRKGRSGGESGKPCEPRERLQGPSPARSSVRASGEERSETADPDLGRVSAPKGSRSRPGRPGAASGLRARHGEGPPARRRCGGSVTGNHPSGLRLLRAARRDGPEGWQLAAGSLGHPRATSSRSRDRLETPVTAPAGPIPGGDSGRGPGARRPERIPPEREGAGPRPWIATVTRTEGSGRPDRDGVAPGLPHAKPREGGGSGRGSLGVSSLWARACLRAE